jgi:hypothetical protein
MNKWHAIYSNPFEAVIFTQSMSIEAFSEHNPSRKPRYFKKKAGKGANFPVRV